MGAVRAIPVHRVREIPSDFRKISVNNWDYSFMIYRLMDWADIPEDDEADPKCVCIYGDGSDSILVFEQKIIDRYGIKVSTP